MEFECLEVSMDILHFVDEVLHCDVVGRLNCNLLHPSGNFCPGVTTILMQACFITCPNHISQLAEC